MSGFQVVYRQGSFLLMQSCETRESALARALALLMEAGVWDVHVEDSAGNAVFCRLEAHPRAA